MCTYFLFLVSQRWLSWTVDPQPQVTMNPVLDKLNFFILMVLIAFDYRKTVNGIKVGTSTEVNTARFADLDKLRQRDFFHKKSQQ